MWSGSADARPRWENFLDPGFAAEELIDAEERVVVRWHGRGAGRASGLPPDRHETHVYELRDGKLAVVQEHLSREQALEAVGLSAGPPQ